MTYTHLTDGWGKFFAAYCSFSLFGRDFLRCFIYFNVWFLQLHLVAVGWTRRGCSTPLHLPPSSRRDGHQWHHQKMKKQNFFFPNHKMEFKPLSRSLLFAYLLTCALPLLCIHSVNARQWAVWTVVKCPLFLHLQLTALKPACISPLPSSGFSEASYIPWVVGHCCPYGDM